MSASTYFNATAGPVVCDEEGHTIDGGGWRELEPDAVTRAAVKTGSLRKVETPEPAKSKTKEG